MPSKKKKYNARFPAGRIKKIMQTDEEVGKVAQAVPVIISRTLELFVESLLTKSLQVTQSRNAKTLSPSHLKQCIFAESRFDFLRDMVKNIPDVSQAEEKEAAHNRSGESSPTASRFPESKPRQTRPTASSHINGQSSDSGSDYEPVNKRPKNPHGNGRNIRQYPNRQTDKQSAVPLTIPKPEIILPNVQHTAPLITSSAVIIPQPATPRPSRLPNFYQETLKEDEDSDKKETPVYSSVIQPNPEYSRSAGFYKQTEDVSVTRPNYLNAGFKDTVVTHSGTKISEPAVPRLHIDLSRGFRDNTQTTTTKTPTTPMFHLDLSSMPLTPQSERNNLPFTPTLIRQPHTPIFKDSGIFKTGLQRSESLNQFGSTKKGPPPALQTLKRTTSLYDSPHSPHLRNSAAAASNLNEVEDLSVPKIKIDITTDGQIPKFHLDLSNYKFESDRNVPSPSTIVAKKRKGHVSNEPPPLLPINPVLKSAPATLTSNTFRKGSSLEMQLDEDYDT